MISCVRRVAQARESFGPPPNRPGYDVYHLGPRDDSPADEADALVADHDLGHHPRRDSQRRPTRSDGQTPPLVDPHELHGSEHQPSNRHQGGTPTEKSHLAIPTDDVLRSRTVRFRGLIFACSSAKDHEGSVTRR